MAHVITVTLYGYRCTGCGAKEQDVFKITADHKRIVCLGCGASDPYLTDIVESEKVERVHTLLDAFQTFVDGTLNVLAAWEKVDAFDVLTETAPSDFPEWSEFVHEMIEWRDRAAEAAGMTVPELRHRAKGGK